jgi:HK97 family phage prohead protease
MPAEKPKFMSFGFEVKSLDEKTFEFEGYASTFNNIDLGGDKVLPGAFKKTVKENRGKFPILADHDPSNQIGWNREASEDQTGLVVRGKLLVNDIAKAREKYSLMKEALELEAKAGLSIGYLPIKWEIDEDKETGGRYRKLKEIKLYEYSFVTFPMNTEAMATAAKELEWLEDMHDPEAAVHYLVDQMLKKSMKAAEIKHALDQASKKMNDKNVDLMHLFALSTCKAG